MLSVSAGLATPATVIPDETIARLSRWGASHGALLKALGDVTTALQGLEALSGSQESLALFFANSRLAENGVSAAVTASVFSRDGAGWETPPSGFIESLILHNFGLILLPSDMPGEYDSSSIADTDLLFLSREYFAQQMLMDIEPFFPGLAASVGRHHQWPEESLSTNPPVFIAGVCSEIDDISRAYGGLSDRATAEVIRKHILTQMDSESRQAFLRAFHRLFSLK